MVYRGPAKSTAVWAKGWKVKRSLVFKLASSVFLCIHYIHGPACGSPQVLQLSKISHSIGKEWSLFQPHDLLSPDSSSQSVLSPSFCEAE